MYFDVSCFVLNLVEEGSMKVGLLSPYNDYKQSCSLRCRLCRNSKRILFEFEFEKFPSNFTARDSL